MLSWHLEYGNKNEWFEKLEEQGEPDIPALDTRPSLYPDLLLDWRAFHEISSSRPSGFGLSYIPLSQILAYMLIHGIVDYEERKELIKRIHILDNTFMAYHAEEKAKTKKKKGPAQKTK